MKKIFYNDTIQILTINIFLMKKVFYNDMIQILTFKQQKQIKQVKR